MSLARSIEDIVYKIHEAENVLDEAQSALSEIENLKNCIDSDFENIFEIMGYYELYSVGENPETDKRNLQDIALLAPILKKNYYNLQKNLQIN